jgi:hypothetical protein
MLREFRRIFRIVQHIMVCYRDESDFKNIPGWKPEWNDDEILMGQTESINPYASFLLVDSKGEVKRTKEDAIMVAHGVLLSPCMIPNVQFATCLTPALQEAYAKIQQHTPNFCEANPPVDASGTDDGVDETKLEKSTTKKKVKKKNEDDGVHHAACSHKKEEHGIPTTTCMSLPPDGFVVNVAS